jgi:hypothetical protein
MKTMDREHLSVLETIDYTPLAPWDPPAFEEISIDSDRDRASDSALALATLPSTVVYSDASASQDDLGAAAVILDHSRNIAESRQVSVGSKKHWSIHAAELIGIYYAIDLVKTRTLGDQYITATDKSKITIISDSQSALKAIANPANRSGQHIVYAILQPRI